MAAIERVEVKPPQLTIGPLAWLRKNLFSTWYNVALTLLAACSPDRPEARIRKAFEASAKAVEAGDAAAAVEILDAGFRGPEGMTKAEARVFLLGWFRRDQVGVTVVAQRIEVRGHPLRRLQRGRYGLGRHRPVTRPGGDGAEIEAR